jgi:formate hydrogenlyase transcriptional activator
MLEIRIYSGTQMTSNQPSNELELLKRQNELILQAAGEGIYGVDNKGMTIFVNPAAARMLGWEADALIGQPMHALLHHTRPDGSHFPKEECSIYAAFKDGAVHHVDDEVFWRKDGSSLPVAYTSTPILENGKLAGAVVVFRDITEQKLADQKLHQAYSEIEQMKEQLEAENVYLQEEYKLERNFAGIVGQSNAIQQVMQQIELVAATDASVLISGESGTGKELIASAIHEQSKRHGHPWIRVNCAAIPRELFESEFFGHVKGAFTGALKDRTGRFSLANGGTIFLDEVGEIPLELQSKLLRVLQEGQFERVGEEKTSNVDVRIVAASNRDLKADIDANRFREDLYFRLNVFPIEAAPLRNRRDDIPLLATHFITLICRRMNRQEPRLTQANLKQLQSYSWPGNIRELQNVIERAIILSKGNRLQFDLPDKDTARDSTFNEPTGHDETDTPFTETERLARDRANIQKALHLSNGRISGENGAAGLLGIKPTTLASRMKALDIQR